MKDAVTDRLVETLLWLCRIPSPTGEEASLANAMLERLAHLPVAAPPRRHGDSIVVPVTRGTGGPRIALVGHLDVVRTIHDGPPRVDEDKLYGPGASDMKSGLALMLDMLEHDMNELRGADVTMIFYAREEGPFAENELGHVFAEDPDATAVDLAICMEPSDNKLSLGACGTIHARIIFEGRTAHSARPWQGENAIHKAGSLLMDLGKLEPRVCTIDGLSYRSVMSATMAEGGRGRNIIPDVFMLNVNHRFAPDTSLPEAQMEIERLVAGRARIEWVDLSPSAPPHAAHPLVLALRDAGVAGVEAKQAWTDVARFAEHGVPAVNWGPGENAQAHQRNEWTSISKLREGREILGRFFRTIAR
ncbi:MAG: succinyl-diaminopimelate desuccinylase [Polyangiaceae bacterium]|nr:succinyl-diaminopimelate desuccinylase [Polyangiaceae bacterium]